MQTLYAVEAQEDTLKQDDPVKLLRKQFDQTSLLVLYLVYFLTEVARYAETDAKNKAAKHLPSKQDLTINTKISGNELLWIILENPSFVQATKLAKPELLIDNELLKKIYQELVSTNKYQQYISKEGREKKDEKEMLEYIMTDLLLPNEAFTSHLEEKFINWDDDGEMVQGLVANFIAKPQSFSFQQIISPEKLDFALKLLETTREKKELALDYIRPKLKNWEPDRIALLDMLLMRMGVCEFLFFETIPPKVTINEYIDLAKEYSTQQSGQFINGILDNIHKELVREDKMHKVAFKPS
ncbi:MAG TPA: transcription antitermination factor NusB [Flavitalea sp.]|nr:transcription antitermination factor NusB [Flavitalea sp.]